MNATSPSTQSSDSKLEFKSRSSQPSNNRDDHNLKLNHHPNSSSSQRLAAASSSSVQKERDLNDLAARDPLSGNSSTNDHLGSEFNGTEPNLDALGSLERDLPVELSFLIRQQAYCMAKMNYLDRQIRELKEVNKARVPSLGSTNGLTNVVYQQAPLAQMSTMQPQANYRLLSHHHLSNQHQQSQSQSQLQQLHQSQLHHHLNHHQLNHNSPSSATGNITTGATAKNQFIPSDDSGGEYSRATISDDDELSSLLDQIAKTVKTERNNLSHRMHQLYQQPTVQQQPLQQQQQHRAGNYSILTNCQSQPFSVLNHPYINQHHHPAVAATAATNGATAMPVFLMSSPIAVATAHPSSITSNILPGIHFQPETRYNQYYGEFYNQNQADLQLTSDVIDNGNNYQQQQRPHHYHHHHRLASAGAINGPADNKSQFDNSISVIEQLVAQKERRQIKSQLNSADNWLKMRSSSSTNHLNQELDINGKPRSKPPIGSKLLGGQPDRKGTNSSHHQTASSNSLSSPTASVSASPPINKGIGASAAPLPATTARSARPTQGGPDQVENA